jgi:protein required for attachment to host cells
MTTAHTTWILIADAACAEVLQTIGIGKKLLPVSGFAIERHIPAGRALTSERPTRTHDSVGDGRHGIEPKSDPRRALKRAFAEEIAERLDAAVHAKAFDRLVVAAPPAMLGDLRNCFTRAVRETIIAEIPHDLVKVPHKDLRVHLEPYAAV